MYCIIPIAGLGTRLLPLTKVIPKAMLPIAGKPCVQWIVEELSAAGLTEIIFVYSKGQDMVREYFAEKTWYDQELVARGKQREAEMLNRVRQLARFQFVEQKELLGDGHAILQARKLIPADEPFLVIFGDCLYQGDQAIQKLMDAHEKTKTSIVAVQEIPASEAKNYGIAEMRDFSAPGTALSESASRMGRNDRNGDEITQQIKSLIEKPSLSSLKAMPRACRGASSVLAIIGRYLLTPAIWPHLEKCLKDSGEARLIDTLQSLLKQESISAVEMHGQWLDTGTPEGLEKSATSLSSRAKQR